jgi:hypothetical protein
MSPICRGLALLAALGANQHLTELELQYVQLGGQDAAMALASSLRSNGTLRTLTIKGGDWEREPGLHHVFEALSGSEGRPSRCALTTLSISEIALDLAACIALADSLSRGALQCEPLHTAFPFSFVFLGRSMSNVQSPSLRCRCLLSSNHR